MAEDNRDVAQDADDITGDLDLDNDFDDQGVPPADDTAADSSTDTTETAEPSEQLSGDVDDRGVPWRNRAAEMERKYQEAQADRDDVAQRFTNYVAQTQPVIERQHQQAQPQAPPPAPSPSPDSDPQVLQAYELLKPHIEQDIEARTSAAEQRAAAAEKHTVALQNQFAYLQFQQENPEFNLKAETVGLQQFIRSHPGVDKLPTTTALNLYRETRDIAAGANGGPNPPAKPPREPRGGRRRVPAKRPAVSNEDRIIMSGLRLSEEDFTAEEES